MLDQKSLVQKIHRLRSTATNNIVEENQEVNQDHRGGLNIRGQGRGKRVAGARGRGKVNASAGAARRDCIYCRKYYKRHLPKCPSKNHDPLVQNNFYASEASEEENGEINFQMILNEVCETNSKFKFRYIH